MVRDMPNQAHPGTVRALLSRARYEILPTASIADTVLEHVPRERTLTITASTAKGLAATLDLAELLAGHGYHAVPHLAARMISGRSELTEIVDRLTGLGVEGIFVPAGDATPPAGDYDAALGLLEDLAGLGSPFARVGIAGYPEPHPSISDDVLIQAMYDKIPHATELVSNMCFDPKVLSSWVHQIRSRGVDLPLLVGMPGPVQRTKLLSMATKIGVGESTRFLSKHRSLFARIASPGGYSPRRFLEKIVPLAADPQAKIAGLHIYTFNQVAGTERWLSEWLEELGGREEQAGPGE